MNADAPPNAADEGLFNEIGEKSGHVANCHNAIHL